MGRKNPWSDLHKIFTGGDIQNVITDANLEDDRLSRFCVARGLILGFSIGFRSRPYNTRTTVRVCDKWQKRNSVTTICRVSLSSASSDLLRVDRWIEANDSRTSGPSFPVKDCVGPWKGQL